MKIRLFLIVLIQISACAQTPAERAQDSLLDSAHADWRSAPTRALLKQANEAGIRITEGDSFPRPYRVLRHLTERVYITSAASEADAELRAFYTLLLSARAIGSEDIIRIEREILEDGVLVDRRRIDNITTARYLRGLGELSAWPTDIPQNRPRVLARSVRFNATAVVFE